MTRRLTPGDVIIFLPKRDPRSLFHRTPGKTPSTRGPAPFTRGRSAPRGFTGSFRTRVGVKDPPHPLPSRGTGWPTTHPAARPPQAPAGPPSCAPRDFSGCQRGRGAVRRGVGRWRGESRVTERHLVPAAGSGAAAAARSGRGAGAESSEGAERPELPDGGPGGRGRCGGKRRWASEGTALLFVLHLFSCVY